MCGEYRIHSFSVFRFMFTCTSKCRIFPANFSSGKSKFSKPYIRTVDYICFNLQSIALKLHALVIAFGCICLILV